MGNPRGGAATELTDEQKWLQAQYESLGNALVAKVDATVDSKLNSFEAKVVNGIKTITVEHKVDPVKLGKELEGKIIVKVETQPFAEELSKITKELHEIKSKNLDLAYNGPNAETLVKAVLEAAPAVNYEKVAVGDTVKITTEAERDALRNIPDEKRNLLARRIATALLVAAAATASWFAGRRNGRQRAMVELEVPQQAGGDGGLRMVQ